MVSVSADSTNQRESPRDSTNQPISSLQRGDVSVNVSPGAANHPVSQVGHIWNLKLMLSKCDTIL